MIVDNEMVAIMGLVLLFAALVQLINTVKFMKKAVSGKGVIVGKGRKSDFTSGGIVNFVNIEFDVNRKTYKFFANVINVNKYVEGMEVDVLYSPENPPHVYMDSFGQLYFIEFIMACIATAMMAVYLD